MKERIRVHQLRIGMFVEELHSTRKNNQWNLPFLINSSEQIMAIMSCNAISAVINTEKSTAAPAFHEGEQDIRKKFEQSLSNKHSLDDLKQAKMVIAETLPKIKELFASAPREGGIDLDIASALVRAVIGSIVANGGALISLSKLRTKDEDTFIHSISVCALLVTFGRKLNLEDGLIRDLGLAGLLHDVGKMAIPEYILQKSEKLSEDEFRIVRMHPRLGFELLSGKSVLPGTVLDICLHHHEKFDGSGYPFGLAGEKIPYVARLAAICDVYDALTTRRAYKGTWSQAQAVDSMMRSRGHFDPSLLRLFVSQMVLSGELM